MKTRGKGQTEAPPRKTNTPKKSSLVIVKVADLSLLYFFQKQKHTHTCTHTHTHTYTYKDNNETTAC